MKALLKIATIADAFDYLLSLSPKLGTWTMSNVEREQRLPRMRLFLEELGNPHQAYKSFHVAGTKGKGSTAAFLASILEAAGYRTGLYTSPHVSDPAERVAVFDSSEVNLPDEHVLRELVRQVAQLVESLPQRSQLWDFPVSMFELLTLFAMLYFREAGCRYVVLETGIGGRYDATNVVKPLASVLTPVDFDHTEIPGETLAEIAWENSRIIKTEVPVFCGRQAHAVTAVVQEACRSQHRPVNFLDEELEEFSSRVSLEGTELSLKFPSKARRTCRLRLLGDFQAQNAALAYLTIRKTFPDIEEDVIERGLQEAFLPGRMELIPSTPPLMLDGAHTPFSVRSVLDSFQKIFPGQAVLIFSSVAGKNPEQMAKILAPACRAIVVSTPGSFKQSDPEAVFDIFRNYHPTVFLEKDPQKALQKARTIAVDGLPILVTGSFFLVGEIRNLVR